MVSGTGDMISGLGISEFPAHRLAIGMLPTILLLLLAAVRDGRVPPSALRLLHLRHLHLRRHLPRVGLVPLGVVSVRGYGA